MSRRAFLLGLLAIPAVASLPALAGPPAGGGHGAEGGEGDGTGGLDEKEMARSVELSGLVFPVFTKRGKLLNYLFVNARLKVAEGKDPWKYREKGHFIRDAILRAAHRTSFGDEKDKTKLNEAVAMAECIKAANASVSENGAFVGMAFTQIASQIGR